jgi:hypothetical protein
MLLRPYSMTGQKWHDPIYSPYTLYADVDRVYDVQAIEENNAWSATQEWMNLVETAAYIVYAWLAFRWGQKSGKKSALDAGVVGGRKGAFLLVFLWGTFLTTFYKTVIYWLLEAVSGESHLLMCT